MTDMVNHPPHYERHKITLEPIDILESVPFAVANVFKYIIRAQDKGNELEDLKKALWYLDRYKNGTTSFEGSPRFWVFEHSDIPMLRNFAVCLREETPADAYSILRVSLFSRISELEKAK